MSFEMLMQLTDLCPDELWYQKKNGAAFWHIIFHSLSGVHYWMRLIPGKLPAIFPEKQLYPDFEEEQIDTLSKEEIAHYSKIVRIACENYFQMVKPHHLCEQSVFPEANTNLDIILLLIRHIQYHTGQCNTILKENNQKTVSWIE